jgi:hypothetical protein
MSSGRVNVSWIGSATPSVKISWLFDALCLIFAEVRSIPRPARDWDGIPKDEAVLASPVSSVPTVASEAFPMVAIPSAVKVLPDLVTVSESIVEAGTSALAGAAIPVSRVIRSSGRTTGMAGLLMGDLCERGSTLPRPTPALG